MNSEYSTRTHTIESNPINDDRFQRLVFTCMSFSTTNTRTTSKFSDIERAFLFLSFLFRIGRADRCLYVCSMHVCFFFLSCVLLIVAQFSISRTPAHSYMASEILTFRMITLSFCQLLILFFCLLFDSLSLCLNLVRTSFVRPLEWSMYGLCMVLRWHIQFNCFERTAHSSQAHILCKQ